MEELLIKTFKDFKKATEKRLKLENKIKNMKGEEDITKEEAKLELLNLECKRFKSFFKKIESATSSFSTYDLALNIEKKVEEEQI